MIALLFYLALQLPANADMPLDPEPGPWIEGVDVDEVTGAAYKIGDPCPEAAHGNCYLSPNKPKEPPPGCVSEFCVSS